MYPVKTPEERAAKRAEVKKQMEAEHMASLANRPDFIIPKMDNLNSWIEVCSKGYQGD